MFKYFKNHFSQIFYINGQKKKHSIKSYPTYIPHQKYAFMVQLKVKKSHMVFKLTILQRSRPIKVRERVEKASK